MPSTDPTKRISRRTFLSGVAAGAAALLAACGTAPQTPSGTTSAPPVAAGAAATAAPAVSAPAASGGPLTVSYMASGTYDVAAKQLATTFGQQNGVSVQVAAFPWATLRQNNTNDLVSGSGQYDVMSGGYYLADSYSYFQPISDLMQRDNYGAGMLQGVLDVGRSEWFNAQHIGAPYGIDAYGLLYRTDLFKAAGVESKMATWADVVKAAETLKGNAQVGGAGIAPFVFAFGQVDQLPAIFFASYGGSYITADGKYVLEPDKAAKAIDTVKAMVPYAPPNALSLSIDDANAVFLDGKAAMLVGWPSFVRKNADDPAKSKVVGNWATTTFPVSDSGFPWLSLWQLFIPKTAKNKELSWNWIKAFTSEANAKPFFEQYGIGSMYTSTYNDPDLLKKHGNDFPATVENLQHAKNPPLSGEA